jgi:tail sheath protein
MSETIKEMVLPGTYIEVRAEGLIGVSGIATGNLGVVGTAARGPVGEVVLLGSYAEAVDAFGAYDPWTTAWTLTSPPLPPQPLTLTRTLEQAFRGGASTVYAVRIGATTGLSGLQTARWDLVESGTGTGVVFSLLAATPGTWANAIGADLSADGSDQVLTLTLGKQEETFSGANAGKLFDAVNAGSALVKAVKMPATTTGTPATVLPGTDRTKTLKTPGALTAAQAGADGAGAGATEAGTGLALLAGEAVHIVVVGGLSVADVSSQVLGHLETTENDGRERIAVLGTSATDLKTIGDDDAALASSPRVILVAPGVVANDAARTGSNTRVQLPPPYAAALVAGRLSTLAPHVSMTNKDVAAAGLTKLYTRAEQKQLLEDRVLVLQQNLGFRVLKGITTDDGAFRQITTRRIVDYAKAGVRIGANPYIGKLNNSRVRAALKATLDGFLSGMVLDEMLISYDLDVTATRAQEITGVALVTMTLRPTFSIDFVKVIMNLE